MTPASVKSKRSGFLGRCDRRRRVESAIIFLVVFALFFFFYCLAAGVISSESLFGKCGFKQYYGLPCPGCGITTAITAFMRGQILSAFYIQPAAGIMCSLLAVLGILSLLTAFFGVDCQFLPSVRQWRRSYLIAAMLIIFAFGWAVTLARAWMGQSLP